MAVLTCHKQSGMRIGDGHWLPENQAVVETFRAIQDVGCWWP